jgi:thiamine-phosphate pyrophosphorylase
MPLRQTRSIPTIWLMTDPRLGDGLLAAIQRLPFGSGVVFRHYHLDEGARRKLFGTVRRICARRGHQLLLAGDPVLARNWRADGVHGGFACAGTLHSMAVHDLCELAKARLAGADMIFLSPLYATQSHPGARSLGLHRFNQLARLAYPAKVIALGGMTRNRARSLDTGLVHGWAAIGAFGK